MMVTFSMLKTERTVAAKMYMIACAIWLPGHALRSGGVNLLRTRVHACIYSPASIAEGKVEGIGLGGLAGFGDQAIRVEGHWVLVYLGIMHEVPISGS